MKKLLLLIFLVPVIHAQSDKSQVCTVQAGIKDTMKQVWNCKKGDVLVIESSGSDEDVRWASRICDLSTIKFTGGESRNKSARTICIYSGVIKPIRGKWPN